MSLDSKMLFSILVLTLSPEITNVVVISVSLTAQYLT